jgi:hypothetical protein
VNGSTSKISSIIPIPISKRLKNLSRWIVKRSIDESDSSLRAVLPTVDELVNALVVFLERELVSLDFSPITCLGSQDRHCAFLFELRHCELVYLDTSTRNAAGFTSTVSGGGPCGRFAPWLMNTFAIN